MAELQEKGGLKANRVFEQPPDAVSLYSDMAQVLATEHEVVLQFYETIPKPPGPQGQIAEVVTRLRATVVLSPSHARNVGKLLMTELGAAPPDLAKQ